MLYVKRSICRIKVKINFLLNRELASTLNRLPHYVAKKVEILDP